VFCHALAEVIRRIAARATPLQMKRFVDSARAYFSALLWEASNRVAHRIPPLVEYRRMRRLSGAVPTTFDLIDVVGGFELGAEDRARPDLRTLYWSAVDITCWSNDILSYAKELQRGGDFHNLPSVLQQEHRCSIQEAMAIASQMHDDEVRHFIEVERQVLESDGSTELRRYVAGLRSWIQGNYRWSLETARYLTQSN
ncbi:MAG TPA: terpene synthase, partial [Nannocystis sp.]